MKAHASILFTTILLTLTTACSNATPVSEQATHNTATKIASSQTNTNQTEVGSQGLSSDVEAGLKLMYEEEKLASDVYATLYDKWQIQAFNNIASTELRHQQAVENLIATYNISVEQRLPAGQFADPQLQQAYDELIAKGMQSEKDALEVGAYVEELDIQDLNHLLTLDNPQDIRQTYEWLNMGSRNHLRGFVRNMDIRGIDYQPQLLAEQAYLSIINGEHERGMGMGGGRGKGHGL